MSDTVIKVENLSKQYRLGLIGTGTLSHDLNRWWYRFRGKDDPYLKIGEVNDREEKSKGDLVWALKDINLNVKQGEVLGIIGKNGAGKSTLLKILSQVTGPTTGSVKVKGRIGSLLEVGTGFHPELTGRENIFLNGAILGMTKSEVRSKLNEIVEFSGTVKYIDTPVKRYSSGMKVRLAFAVAAHLDPEILVVDEVLAVGDAEFQNKAIGKMNEVSRKGGRTVLFVSHNMSSVQMLCSRAISLNNGKINNSGIVEDVISSYLSDRMTLKYNQKWDFKDAPGNENIKLNVISIKPINTNSEIIFIEDDIEISISYWCLNPDNRLGITLRFFSEQGILLFVTGTGSDKNWHGKKFKNGNYQSKVVIPGHLFNSGRYRVEILFGHASRHVIARFDELFSFEVHDSAEGRASNFKKAPGLFRPLFNWETQLLENV